METAEMGMGTAGMATATATAGMGTATATAGLATGTATATVTEIEPIGTRDYPLHREAE
jgi:hypothetical protein